MTTTRNPISALITSHTNAATVAVLHYAIGTRLVPKPNQPRTNRKMPLCTCQNHNMGIVKFERMWYALAFPRTDYRRLSSLRLATQGWSL